MYHWLGPAGQTLGYYFNIADETRFSAERIEWRDLTVDVLATPAGRLDVVDEHELPADLDPALRARVEAGLRAILDDPAAVVSGDRSAPARALAAGVSGRRVKALVQRVSRASVSVAGETVADIARGLLVLVGVARGDTEADAQALARKLCALRIFPGRTPMDLALGDVGGACLLVSQFTLAADLGKGNRPSFEPAEAPARAEALFGGLVAAVAATGIGVATGRFGADMQVALVNDGPVTFLLEARAGKLVT